MPAGLLARSHKVQIVGRLVGLSRSAQRVEAGLVDQVGVAGLVLGDQHRFGSPRAEAQFVYRLQTVGGFGGKSDQLNAYNMFLRDPGFFDRDLERYHQVTAASLRDSVRRYVAHSNRITLSVVPKGKAIYGMPGSVPSLVS